jgi:hypothetical protein
MATKELSFSLPIGSSFTAELEDQNLSAEMYKLYNAVNLIAAKLDEYTGAINAQIPDRPYIPPVQASSAAGVNRVYAEATVDLLKGTIVAFNASGQLIKASASTGVHAIVMDDTVAPNWAPATLQGLIDGFTALTPGQYYVASTTPGAIATSVPSGTQRRYVGFAITPTTLAFYPDMISVVQP